MDTTVQASLDLHSSIFQAFELAAKAGFGAVCGEVSLEDVRSRLTELQSALADTPSVDGLARDLRLLPFRRARLAIKPAAESALILEPEFCDPVITREKTFASYHDAALNLASEMAEVLADEFAGIQQEKRLPIEQMCRTASQVPHENLGTEGVYWLRILSIYDEYLAGMTSEASYLYMPSGGHGGDEVGDGRSSIRWTKPMTKKDAAAYLRCPVTKKSQWINGLIRDGKLRCVEFNRQNFKFGLERFPESLWGELSESPID